jgi:hypothetical protein
MRLPVANAAGRECPVLDDPFVGQVDSFPGRKLEWRIPEAALEFRLSVSTRAVSSQARLLIEPSCFVIQL